MKPILLVLAFLGVGCAKPGPAPIDAAANALACPLPMMQSCLQPSKLAPDVIAACSSRLEAAGFRRDRDAEDAIGSAVGERIVCYTR